MKITTFSRLILALFTSTALFFVGCEKTAGDRLDDAIDETGDALDEAGDTARDAADEARDAVDDAVN
ncbi:MAG TPA: hypothetical protein VK041_04220 [Opitutales bacterium]|nr:hypothetical protein [Opitutales bacterium]